MYLCSFLPDFPIYFHLMSPFIFTLTIIVDLSVMLAIVIDVSGHFLISILLYICLYSYKLYYVNVAVHFCIIFRNNQVIDGEAPFMIIT